MTEFAVRDSANLPPELNYEELLHLDVPELTGRLEILINAHLANQPSQPGNLVCDNLDGRIVQGDLAEVNLSYPSVGNSGKPKDVKFSKIIAPDGIYFQITDWGYSHPEFRPEPGRAVRTQWRQGERYPQPLIRRHQKALPIMKEELAGYELGARNGDATESTIAQAEQANTSGASQRKAGRWLGRLASHKAN